MATKTKNTRGTKSRKRPTEKPVDAEIRRAAERAGIDSPEDRAHDRIVAAIGPKLALACDQLGEEIASYRDPNAGGDFSNVVDALYTIWSVRWELGLTPNAAAGEAS